MHSSTTIFRHVAPIHHRVLREFYAFTRHYVAPVHEPGMDVLPQFPL
jgi:hypothetical protein